MIDNLVAGRQPIRTSTELLEALLSDRPHRLVGERSYWQPDVLEDARRCALNGAFFDFGDALYNLDVDPDGSAMERYSYGALSLPYGFVTLALSTEDPDRPDDQFADRGTLIVAKGNWYTMLDADIEADGSVQWNVRFCINTLRRCWDDPELHKGALPVAHYVALAAAGFNDRDILRSKVKEIAGHKVKCWRMRIRSNVGMGVTVMVLRD